MSKRTYKENQEKLESEVKYYCGYAIGSKSTVCGGHGCNYEETKITGEDGWGGGDFPPIFPTEQEARAYIKKKDLFLKDVYKIRLAL